MVLLVLPSFAAVPRAADGLYSGGAEPHAL